MAPVSWGQSPDHLAEHPKWLKLGHYERTLFGYRSPFTEGFFLHPNGHKDPKAELEATLQAFQKPSPELVQRLKMHPQCYYRARFHFLKPHLKLKPTDFAACPEREAWKRQLNAQTVSLIFASADLTSATSSFGHTFLKLGNPENRGGKELIDYGINYAADADQSEGVLYALKGLLGFYQGRFTMLPFHQKIREYTNMEGRDIWEYRLNFSPTETSDLVDHLLEMEGARAPYYFFSDNCSYQIIKALEAVRPELNIARSLPAFVIPLDTVKRSERVPGLVTDITFIRALKSDYLLGYRRLNDRQRQDLKAVIADLKLPDGSPLSPREKGEVLETAMKYYALTAYQNGKDSEEQKYKLSVQRARLGPVTAATRHKTPHQPHLAHESSAFYLGVGHHPSEGGFQSLKLRTAFHDLEQREAGMVEFSHIEFVSVEARHYNREARLSLSRFTLMDIVNTSTITTLDQNLSWRVRGSIEESWRADLIGGAGVSYDLFDGVRFTQIINGRYYHDFLGAGPNFILSLRPAARLGLSLDAAYYFGEASRTLWELRARASYGLTRDFDLQAEHVNAGDSQVKLVYNFLF